MQYWSLFYHFVWGTANREPLISQAWEESLHKVIVAKARQLGATVLAVGGTDDHIHLAVSVPPTLALSRFIGQVKGNSSHFVNHVVHPDMTFAWQDEYGVISFDRGRLKTVAQYVQSQRQHHGAGTLMAGLERTQPEDMAI